MIKTKTAGYAISTEATLKALDDIEARVRPTIGPTFSLRGSKLQCRDEGRISRDDFDVLTYLIREAAGILSDMAETQRIYHDALRLAQMPVAGHA